ncbi:MAG: TetR/AcrR family transcriptional regulator [Pseudomonadota bacterium]
MARPREFDEDEVIEKAMETFWRQGYDATSVPHLEEATGISRISIYNAFGDKEGLFLRALDIYHARAVEIYENTIARGGLDDVIALFNTMAAPTPPSASVNAGCLMCNTILDVRRATPKVKKKIQSYRKMLKRAFHQALLNAREAGDIDADDTTLDQRAEYLVGVLWGTLSMIRVNGKTAAAAPMVAVAGDVVRSWQNKKDR